LTLEILLDHAQPAVNELSVNYGSDGPLSGRPVRGRGRGKGKGSGDIAFFFFDNGGKWKRNERSFKKHLSLAKKLTRLTVLSSFSARNGSGAKEAYPTGHIYIHVDSTMI